MKKNLITLNEREMGIIRPPCASGFFAWLYRSSPNRSYITEREHNYGYGKVFLNKDAYTFDRAQDRFPFMVCPLTLFAIFVDGRVSQITYYRTPSHRQDCIRKRLVLAQEQCYRNNWSGDREKQRRRKENELALDREA